MICILNHVVTCHIVHHILYDILTKLPFDPDIIILSSFSMKPKVVSARKMAALQVLKFINFIIQQ